MDKLNEVMRSSLLRRPYGLLAMTAFLFFCLSPEIGFSEKQESEDEKARKAIEARGRTEILSYFLGDTRDPQAIKTPFAIDLYNQAVEFYQKKEYELARQALQDSLSYDSQNPFALELLGDINYYEQKLKDAEKHYQEALRLRPRKELKEKILKIQKEKVVESSMATYEGEHFLIKYGGEERGLEGFELREYLRNAYREVGQDLGYFFKNQVVVLLYDEKEYRELSGAPHWSGGVYDGKIRLPAYQKGLTPRQIEKIMRHEVTHAFVTEMSRGRCPVWLNEGLAVYEEAKVEPPDLEVFEAAVRSRTLTPLPTLFEQKGLSEGMDPLEARLFYDESYQLVRYLVKRYGMFQIRKMLELYGQGKDTFDVIKEILKTSPLELERQWKDAVT